MNILDGQFRSMAGDYDLLTTGTHTGKYSAFLVLTDCVISAMTTYAGTEKSDTLTLAEFVRFDCAFDSITIDSGSIIAYKG